MGRKVMQRNYDNEGNLISKECSGCHEIKPVSEFNKNKGHIDGLQPKCKECIKKYRQENKDKSKEYRQKNKDRIKERKQEYYQKNKERFKERRQEYLQKNKDRIKERSQEYYQKNKERTRERHRKYYQENKEYHREYYQEYYQKNTQEALQQIKTEVESTPDKYNYIEGKEIYGIIYLVHNTESNKYYIGQTTIGFDNRYPSGWLYDHSHKNTVKHDLELYGENSFEYIKLFKVAYSQYELDKLEAYYIDYYNSFENGYNERRGNIFTDRGKEK